MLQNHLQDKKLATYTQRGDISRLVALLYLTLPNEIHNSEPCLKTSQTLNSLPTGDYSIGSAYLPGTQEGTDASASMESLNDYYAFGEQRLAQGSPQEQRKFTGYEFDSDTGLNYAGARYQSGKWGRFVSQDPLTKDGPEQFLSDPQQLNYYSYARNNPLRHIDPSGKAIQDFNGPIAPSNGINYRTGDTYGSYMGVPIYHNGGNYACSYQCVEFADRFISQQWGIPASVVGGMSADAKDYNATTFNKAFSSTGKTFVTSNNNQPGNTLPSENSIITFGASNNNPYGHVGVVGATSFNQQTNSGNITIAHQNAPSFMTTLPVTMGSNGAYQVQGYSGMPVTGWTSMQTKTAPPPPSVTSGGSQSFVSKVVSGISNTISKAWSFLTGK